MQNIDPEGVPFQTNPDQELKLVTEGEWKGWIAEKHPDGQWVSKKEATLEDLERIATFCKRTRMAHPSSHVGGIWFEREGTVRQMIEAYEAEA